MQKPTTVVLIHGLFMTALSWEKWVERYSQKGYQVIAKSWPGMDGDIEQLRGDPSGVEHLGIGEIVDYYDALIRELDEPPIIIGHSFGGAFTEILLDRGLGAAGVAIDAAAVRGILNLPFSQLKAGFPVLKSPSNIHKAVALTPEQFHYAFTNTLGDSQDRLARSPNRRSRSGCVGLPLGGVAQRPARGAQRLSRRLGEDRPTLRGAARHQETAQRNLASPALSPSRS
jgi:pimeloyl-ACP methyl ester carboxylesterase